MTDHVPFYQCTTDMQVLATVLMNRQIPTLPRNVSVPSHIWCLLEQCWSFPPHKRPWIQHVVQRLKHPARVIAASEDGFICFWHSASGELLRRSSYPASPLLNLCVSATAALIGLAASNGSIAVYDSYSGSELLITPGTGEAVHEAVHEVAFSPDGMYIAEISER